MLHRPPNACNLTLDCTPTEQLRTPSPDWTDLIKEEWHPLSFDSAKSYLTRVVETYAQTEVCDLRNDGKESELDILHAQIGLSLRLMCTTNPFGLANLAPIEALYKTHHRYVTTYDTWVTHGKAPVATEEMRKLAEEALQSVS